MDEKNMTAEREPIGAKELLEFTKELRKYKAGKASVERRAINAESWWKLRNQAQRELEGDGRLSGFNCKSGWLHNVIVSKHADAMEAYPEPNILPREPGDAPEAQRLSKIVPVILDHNRYEEVYSDLLWQKLKTGTGISKIFWDQDKDNGLGDIAIDRVDVLNVFWEPGEADIQKSKYFFHTALIDNDTLEQQYPQLKGRLKGEPFIAAKFVYDDNVSTDGKTTVIDCYYKKWVNGRQLLHYVKYVRDIVIYSTENEGTTLYDHGMYPFVFDAMYPVEGSPTGYGYIDLCCNGQMQLDMMQTAFLRNTMVGAMPRYFARGDGSINEEELLDLDRPIVHVNSNLGEDSLRLVDYKPLSGSYIDMRRYTVDEIRQTTGNTDNSTGATPAGVTAASAITALQEAAGKGIRDSVRTSYRAYKRTVYLVIELIRQFYDLPRQFRITGSMGVQQFVRFDNSGLALRQTGTVNGEPQYRIPVFDIDVKPAKNTGYSRMAQNELALQFYNLGFFAPQQSDQALAALRMMEFDGKDEVMQAIARNGAAAQRLAALERYALAMTAKYEPDRTEALAASLAGQGGDIVAAARDSVKLRKDPKDGARAEMARERSGEAARAE